MDCNPKTPSLWDLENLLVFNGKVCDTPNQPHPIEELGIDSGSSSKSSISVHETQRQVPQFSFQTIEGYPKDFHKKNELKGSGEPRIGLKLGRQTYLEDFSSSLPRNSVKKSRVSCICQVEGCNVDLTGAKDYHRKHRVCESHSKCPKVIVSGLERRFCQQCSRFHELSEFDEKKRSCRRRLSDHNARRRKPQLNTISFGSARLPSSFYDGRQRMNLAFNRVPLVHTTQANITWEDSSEFKPALAKSSWLRTPKEGIDGCLYFPGIELPNAMSTLHHHDSDRLLSFKGAAVKVPGQGLEASMISSNQDATPDIQRALSLLSASARGSSDSLDQIMLGNHASVAQPTMHTGYQGLQLSSSEFLPGDHPSAEPLVASLALHNSGSQLHEFQLFQTPFESAFLDNNLLH
ncbi:hypothetical protein MRB53_022147 [Persea americana]|uniref:Uncharacterized protein n=2 Tax=Persea americana TaxID=3435 RepID=A0ACC2L5V8_PERAE|nr:hypothetical protein MRB53_022147 [Persea americana]QDC27798.1 SQUAMOSA promoter-binding protein-like 2.2 [Persea americana]